MGPSKCGGCSRTKRTKNTFAPGATALLPRAPATLCACRATPPTFAVTGTRVAGNGAAERLRRLAKLGGYSTIQRTNVVGCMTYLLLSSKIATVPDSS